MLIAVVALSSCIKDDLAEIRERLTNLEEWQTSVNSSISALQSIVSAIFKSSINQLQQTLQRVRIKATL